MPILTTKIDVDSNNFSANKQAMEILAHDLQEKLGEIRQGGPETSREKHKARGKLLPRDRVLSLIDKGTEFFELSQFAAYNVYGENVPAAGLITGIGKICGRDCMLVVNDATVKGGSYYPLSVNTCAHSKSLMKTNCPVFILWTQAAQTCPGKTKFSQTGITLAASFIIKQICPRRVFLKSLWSWALVRPEVHMYRRCQISASWLRIKPLYFSQARLW
jgi:hypothetical protein